MEVWVQTLSYLNALCAAGTGEIHGRIRKYRPSWDGHIQYIMISYDICIDSITRKWQTKDPHNSTEQNWKSTWTSGHCRVRCSTWMCWMWKAKAFKSWKYPTNGSHPTNMGISWDFGIFWDTLWIFTKFVHSSSLRALISFQTSSRLGLIMGLAVENRNSIWLCPDLFMSGAGLI